MTETRRNKIPTISAERLDTSPGKYLVESDKKEKSVQAFLKNKEPIQSFTIRMPVTTYQDFRKIAFNKNEKMNQILIHLVKGYIDSDLD